MLILRRALGPVRRVAAPPRLTALRRPISSIFQHQRAALCTFGAQTEMEDAHTALVDPDDYGSSLAASGLTDAVRLLLEQEIQGVAADATQDLFLASVMQDSKLHEAVLAYFLAGMEAVPNSETYTSLIYVCVKLRRLDEGFRYFEAMMAQSILPDARTYAHLLKGCGRTKQIRRGEAFFQLLKKKNAPQIYDVRAYNALLNMYAHQKTRGEHLKPHEASPAWLVFEEMQQRGIIPDEVTYNSLISLCARLARPDVERALGLLREMEAVAVPISSVTISALMQVLGRANMVSEGRAKLRELLDRGATPITSMWRPLMHAAAVSGDLEQTREMMAEMRDATGSDVFDSFKHRVSYASNYLLLASGYSVGYDAARSHFDAARDEGKVDFLTYSFMLELTLQLHSRRVNKTRAITAEGRRIALGLWAEMRHDGVRPTSALCHKMFPVWLQEGMAAEAVATFEEMRNCSRDVWERGKDLADRWLGGDLDAVKQLLTDSPLVMHMCHSSMSYVRLIDAFVQAGRSEDAAAFLHELQAEAKEKNITLGHDLTSPLLQAFSRGGATDIAQAQSVHRVSYEAGRPCAPGPSLGLCRALLKSGTYDDAALILLQMAAPARDQSWIYSVLEQRVSKLQAVAEQMEPLSDARGRLEQAIEQVSLRYELQVSQPAAGPAAGEEAGSGGDPARGLVA
jgi:pentatricopeptide repeat protein